MYIEFGRSRKNANKSYPGILSDNYSPDFINRVIGKFNPFWIKMHQLSALSDVYNENPVLFTALNIKANYLSNIRFDVRDIKTGRVYKKDRISEEKAVDPLIVKMLELMYNPNPLQSKTEFLRLNSINHDLYGNSFMYANFSSFRTFDITTIETLKNLWPDKMKPVLTGMFLSSTKEEDIIKKWELTMPMGKVVPIMPHEILHRKDTNISIRDEVDFVMGKPRAIPLYRPLSNIQVAYESINVMGQNQGVKVIISSAKENPQMGSKPFTPEEKQDLQDEMKDYGLLEGQKQFKFSKLPLNVVQLDQDMRKLGFNEQIASDTMIVCYAFSISELLFKMRFEGATYVNLGEAERQMYQNTTIPFAQDLTEDINVWLKTRQYGYEYVASFDHVKVLQENERERAIINRNNSVTMRDLFMGGGCIFDEWRASLLLDPDPKYGKMHIFELPQEVIMAITGRNLINAQNNLQNQANDNPDAK